MHHACMNKEKKEIPLNHFSIGNDTTNEIHSVDIDGKKYPSMR